VHRVLRPGGTARIMIYHKYSLIGFMLWARYGVLARRPLRGLNDIYSRHLESPGTKAYTVRQAREMCSVFREVRVWSQLSFGDLLEGAVGQRHSGVLLTLAKSLWPRSLIKLLFRRCGNALLLEATK
jgi:hypothetical protein